METLKEQTKKNERRCGMESLMEKTKKNARRFGMSKGKVKKFFVTTAALTALGLLGVASNSFAISQITRAGDPTTTIAREIIDPSNGFGHSADAIWFEVDGPNGINAGSKITVQITGATIENVNNLQLYCQETGGGSECDGDPTNGEAVPLVNADLWDSNGTWVQFTVPAGGLARSEGPGAHPDHYFIAEPLPGGGHRLLININPGASNVGVTIATNEATANENPNSRTNPNFYRAQQQFVMTAGNVDVSETIDVEKDLLKFQPANTAGIRNTETTAYYDNGFTGIQAQTNVIDIPATQIANVGVNFEVTGKMDGIQSMDLMATQNTPETNDDQNIGPFIIDYANNKATASTNLNNLLNGPVAIKLTINGTTPLEDRRLSINAKLVPAPGSDVKFGTTLIDASSDQDVPVGAGFIARGRQIFNFDINGLQFVAPYVRSDSGVSSVIRVENAANRDSKIWWFVNNGGRWSLIGNQDLPKGDVVVKSGQDLISAASTKGIPLDGTKGFAVWGVVKATDPTNNKDITVYGSQQLIGGPFRPLPIQVKGAKWGH